MGTARSCAPVLRDGHVRGAAAGRASGRSALRAGAERRRGAPSLLRERAAEADGEVMGMLPGIPVSAGWVDKAAARVSSQLGKAGFTTR
jgi:hypothetical protein